MLLRAFPTNDRADTRSRAGKYSSVQRRPSLLADDSLDCLASAPVVERPPPGHHVGSSIPPSLAKDLSDHVRAGHEE
jgi:hypothetical protein